MGMARLCLIRPPFPGVFVNVRRDENEGLLRIIGARSRRAPESVPFAKGADSALSPVDSLNYH